MGILGLVWASLFGLQNVRRWDSTQVISFDAANQRRCIYLVWNDTQLVWQYLIYFVFIHSNVLPITSMIDCCLYVLVLRDLVRLCLQWWNFCYYGDSVRLCLLLCTVQASGGSVSLLFNYYYIACSRVDFCMYWILRYVLFSLYP